MSVLQLLSAFAIVTAPSGAAGVTPLERETAVWNAVKAKDMKAFAASMTPDFVGVYANGTHDRARELNIVLRQTLRSFALRNFQVRMVDPDDMLMTYSADVQGTDEGESFSGRYWNTSLWHRYAGKWLTVYHGEAKDK